MFKIAELFECITQAWFREGNSLLQRNLLELRLGIACEPMSPTRRSQLLMFSNAVLASYPFWTENGNHHGQYLCSLAGDIEAALGMLQRAGANDNIHLLAAAILYEIAELPSASAACAVRNGLPAGLKEFFSRVPESYWGILKPQSSNVALRDSYVPDSLDGPPTLISLLEEALAEALDEIGIGLQQGLSSLPPQGLKALNSVADIITGFSTSLSVDLMRSLHKSIQRRYSNSTENILKEMSKLSAEEIRSIETPSEMWPVQRAALESGLLDRRVKSFGLAAPTGTGKSALARVLLANFFKQQPGGKAFYVTPSRALTAEVARSLQKSLNGLGLKVASLGGTLALDDHRLESFGDADLLVFTPEKADLLMRVEPEILNKTGLVIVDEAHHIEQGTRGVLLEFYLWRLRSALPKHARVVQLSAVAPNIGELASWLAPPDATSFTKLDWRAGRIRLGVFERTHAGRGLIQFGDSQPFPILEVGQCSADRNECLAQLALRLSTSGVVLILSPSPGQAEKVAMLLAEMRGEMRQPSGVTAERVDARIERELYADSSLRKIFRRRVVYHHAQLPPRIRAVLEDAIRARDVDIVCATTTLAEGVNFPFSTVIVESLVGKNYQLSPRALWNIAGRAGRFGIDSEGHCIIYRPSGWMQRLQGYTFEQYLKSDLDSIPPVRSALATGLEELKGAIDQDEISPASLSNINLSDIRIDGKITGKARRIRGLLNVMRVGYAHASNSNLISLEDGSPHEFTDGTLLASRQLTFETREFAIEVARKQRRVIQKAADEDEQLVRIAAHVGWSLETQSALFDWLNGRADWQLEQYGSLVMNGQISDFDRLSYLLGPLARYMAELEGETLGGYTSYISQGWLSGQPLAFIRSTQEKKMDFGRLVRVVYARVQYMLPWGLFGLNELVKYVARKRNLGIGHGVGDLSILASEGVPSFDAFHLVALLDIERVDATRLARAYRQSREPTDVTGWFKSQRWNRIKEIVSGPDGRRIDPDLEYIWKQLRQA